MPSYVKDRKTGQVFEDLGGGDYRTIPAEELKILGQSPLETFSNSFQDSLIQAYEGGKNVLQGGGGNTTLDVLNQRQQAASNVNPKSAFMGKAGPAVVAGLASGGAGPAATMLIEGALGAAYSPENPLLGAGIGAAVGGIPFAGPAIRGAGRAAADAIPNMGGLDNPLLGILPQGMVNRMAARPAGGMSGRVMSNIEGAAGEAPKGQYYPGVMTSKEFDDLGVPLTTGMRQTLDAPDLMGGELGKRLTSLENLTGAGSAEKRAQRQWFSKFVTKEMGVVDDVAPTESVVGAVLADRGKGIGNILKAQGDFSVPPEAMASMRQVAEASTDNQGGGRIGTILKNLESSASKNGGNITPEAYQGAITALNDAQKYGGNPGTMQAAAEVRRQLSDQVEKTLDDASKEALRRLRYQYRIAKTINTGAARGDDQLINPSSFARGWNKRGSEVMRGQDPIGKAAATIRLLSAQETHTGNSLQRIIAQAPGQAAAAATSPLGGGAIGSAIATGAYNYLTGN